MNAVGGPVDGIGGGIIEPTVAYSLDWLLYDGVGDVDVPAGFGFDAVLKRNTLCNEPCRTKRIEKEEKKTKLINKLIMKRKSSFKIH